ncbi:MAG: hypothetical protein AAFR61_15485 [Bacteroidota bacterium]
MRQTKLFELLQKLSPSERRRLEKFLLSPYFNESQVLIRLFQYWLNQRRVEHALAEEAIFTHLFPDKKFRKQRLREEYARLYRLLLQFLAQEEQRLHPQQDSLAILAQLRKHQLPRQFDQQKRKLESRLFSQSRRDGRFYYLTHQLADEANGMYGMRQVRVYDAHLQEKVAALDSYYLINRLRDGCEMLNRNQVFHAPVRDQFLEHLLAYLDQHPEAWADSPAIQIYREIVLSFGPEGERHYQRLPNLLDQHHALFSAEEARGLYKYAQNFCIRQINQGHSHYLVELLHLYKAQLSTGVIFSDENLSHTDFKNIVTVGLRLKDFSWVKNFIETYAERVLPPFRDNVYHYCSALRLLEEGNPSGAVRLLQKVQFTDDSYQISARYVMLRAFYEMNDLESLPYLIKAFQANLRRNRSISTTNRPIHQNFLRLFPKLVALKDKKGLIPEAQWAAKADSLRTAIETTPKLSHAVWLKEKLEGL